MPQLLRAVLHGSKLRPALYRDDPQPPKRNQRARFPGEINSVQKHVTSGSVRSGARISRVTGSRDFFFFYYFPPHLLRFQLCF